MPSAEKYRFHTRDIRLTARIAAAPELVYRSLTSARELTRWWLQGAETAALNGGQIRMVWPQLQVPNGVFSFKERKGVFVDLEPARKVAWLWEPLRGEKEAPSLTSIFILPARGGSDVTLIQAGFPVGARADALYERYARAWEDGLAKLKLYLETGRACKLQFLDLEAARILTTRSKE